MKAKSLTLLTLAGAGLLLSGQVSAHTFGAHGAGFADGWAHPFLGLDHLLAMIAVGLWATQLGGSALWRLPVAFITIMAGGALLANISFDSALVESGIALSVLALGLMIACQLRMSLGLSIIAVATFALFHGYAHGLEMPETGTPRGYGAGFLLSTAALHLVGVALGLSASRLRGLVRLAGAAIAAMGLVMLVTA